MSELKPCPFCGSENLYVDGYEHGSGKRWRIVCLDCMGMVDPGTIQQKYRAIEAWNLRVDGWIPVSERLPESVDSYALVIASGKPHPNISLVNAYELAEYSKAEGWMLENYPDWEDADVTHWMPLPEPPKEAQP